MNLNKVYLIGRLTADPEYRTTTTGQDVTTLRIATNRIWTNASGQKQESSEFHTVVTWGRLAQIANQYLQKGGLVMIEGRLQTRSWEDRDGKKRYRTEVIAENIQLGPRFQGKAPIKEKEPVDETAPAKNVAQKEAVKEEEIPIINEGESLPEDLSSDLSAEASAKVEALAKEEEAIEETEIDLKEVPF